MRGIVPIAMLLALASAACSTPDPGAIRPPSGDPQGRPVAVTLTEYEIAMEVSLDEGFITFIVTNDGTMAHNFALVGEDLDHRFDEPLQPGETLTLTTYLEAGIYDVFCPVDEDRSRGMEVSIQVIGAEIP